MLAILVPHPPLNESCAADRSARWRRRMAYPWSKSPDVFMTIERVQKVQASTPALPLSFSNISIREDSWRTITSVNAMRSTRDSIWINAYGISVPLKVINNNSQFLENLNPITVLLGCAPEKCLRTHKLKTEPYTTLILPKFHRRLIDDVYTVNKQHNNII